jgi:hypothetical protein
VMSRPLNPHLLTIFPIDTGRQPRNDLLHAVGVHR